MAEVQLLTAVVTPARDEADVIADTIASVRAQSRPPVAWVIVDDGSRDGTAEIVERAIEGAPWITLVRRDGTSREDFASKVHAFQEGLRVLDGVDHDLLTNLDADVTLPTDYFERIAEEFELDPALGIAGGTVVVEVDGRIERRRTSDDAVAGAVQCFRRECFDDVGGIPALRRGGEDAAAQIMARSRGWSVRRIPGLEVVHHGKVLNRHRSSIAAFWSRGIVNRGLGYDPVFQSVAAVYRMRDRPFVLGGSAFLGGYWWAAMRRESRSVSDDAVRHLRREQRRRLRDMLGRREPRAAAEPLEPADEVLVLWGNSPWDGHRLGAQFLAEALSVHHDVLYIDPPTSVLRRIRADGWRSLRESSHSMQVADGILRVRPVGPPGIRRPLIRRLTSAAARRSARSATRRLGRPVRAVISGYLDVQPFGCSGERWGICRISDDFSSGSELGLRIDHLKRAQELIARKADAVVSVSQPLVDQWRRAGYDPVLIPNGCDVARLVAASDTARPASIRLDRPIVGYCGQLSKRIDLGLLEAVADSGCSLLLVGGIRHDVDRQRVDRLIARPNVQWLGARVYDEVPPLLTSMAVGLMPYTDTAFNRASFPLKLLEYLGAGAAPVSIDLPAVRWIGSDLVRIADGPDAFVAAVAEALASADDQAEQQRRRDLAANHSWQERAAAYVDVLDRLDAGFGGSQSSAP